MCMGAHLDLGRLIVRSLKRSTRCKLARELDTVQYASDVTSIREISDRVSLRLWGAICPVTRPKAHFDDRLS
jgi:hypothetical protein